MNSSQTDELNKGTNKCYITTITYEDDSYRIAPLVFGYDSIGNLILHAHTFYKGNQGKVSSVIFNSDANLSIFDCSKITYVNCDLDDPLIFKSQIEKESLIQLKPI